MRSMATAERQGMEKRTQIYFFPGNPYVYELYDHLLSLLEDAGADHGGVSARLIKYAKVPEHMLRDPSEVFRYIAEDVEQQICEHERSRAHDAPTRRVLVGHSFGSYIANQVTSLLSSSTAPHLTPDTCIYIFPFLARPTLSGRLTLAVADAAYRRHPALARALEGPVTSVFNAVLHTVSSRAKRGIVTPKEVLRAIFRVAACERQEIGGKKDLSHVLGGQDACGQSNRVRPYGGGGGGSGGVSAHRQADDRGRASHRACVAAATAATATPPTGGTTTTSSTNTTTTTERTRNRTTTEPPTRSHHDDVTDHCHPSSNSSSERGGSTRPRKWLLYTKGDQWCPHWVWEAWPADLRVDLSHVPHAFPCHERHDLDVAKTIERILFGGGDGGGDGGRGGGGSGGWSSTIQGIKITPRPRSRL